MKLDFKSIKFITLSLLFVSSILNTSLVNADEVDVLRLGDLNVQSSINMISHSARLRIIGKGEAGSALSLRMKENEKRRIRIVANSQGRYNKRIKLGVGMNKIEIRKVSSRKKIIVARIAYMPMQNIRPFTGSPTSGLERFERLFPNSISYDANLPSRTSATLISKAMAESAESPKFSNRIGLGLVFFAQFVDHDLDRIQSKGQGPSSDPVNPINIRTPALDLDSVYGAGLQGSTEFYLDDQMHFKLGKSGADLLRDSTGKALIGDDRNDENGFIAAIHLAFQRYHNYLVDNMLHDMDVATLSSEQRSMIFHGVRNLVIARYQGIVANQMSLALSGVSIPDNIPAIKNIPIEFAGAVYRLGHTLIPQDFKIDNSGKIFSPVDPKLRGDASAIDLNVLFGSEAQKAGEFDNKISQVMRQLLIPLSPSDLSQGHMIGGQSPNIGSGQIIDGVLHLDLIETNILRGRELALASGEECFFRMYNLAYQPVVHGNTDLFAYILDEASGLGYLGNVGSYIYIRTIGGVLSADPYRYFNTDMYSDAQIREFRSYTMEKLLAEIS